MVGGGISRRISIGCAREAKWVEVDRAGRRRTSRREKEKERERNFASSSGLAFWYKLGVGSRAQQSGGPIRARPRGHPGPPFPSPTLCASPRSPSRPARYSSPVSSAPITFSCFSLRTPSTTPPPSQRGISHNVVFLRLLLLLLRRSLFSFSLKDRRSGAARRGSSSSFPSVGRRDDVRLPPQRFWQFSSQGKRTAKRETGEISEEIIATLLASAICMQDTMWTFLLDSRIPCQWANRLGIFNRDSVCNVLYVFYASFVVLFRHTFI